MPDMQTRRLSVPLSEHDDAELARLRSTETLETLGLAPSASDAALVHAVFDLGLRQLRERRMESAYAELALTYDDATARNVARRRRPLSADDE